MKKLHMQRWQNAVNIANKINSLFAKGYWIFDGQVPLKYPLVITSTEIKIKYNDNAFGRLFEANEKYDHGLYTPIKEYNKRFNSWYAVNPKNVRHILLTRKL